MILAIIIHSVRVVILGGLFLVDNVGLKKSNRIIRCFPSITSRSSKVSLRSYYITTHQSFCTFSNLFFCFSFFAGSDEEEGRPAARRCGASQERQQLGMRKSDNFVM